MGCEVTHPGGSPWEGAVGHVFRSLQSGGRVERPAGAAITTLGGVVISRESRDGAERRTRTGTGSPPRPSNVRVYQFRHFGAKNISIRTARYLQLDPGYG